MKLVIALLFIALISALTYRFSAKTKTRNALLITLAVAVALTSLMIIEMYRAASAPDTQCTTTHIVHSVPPANLKTSIDYFDQGNFDYDSGNCTQAIADYTKSIELDPNYPQSYNNRAYTAMRMQHYQSALSDLDQAISLNPNYSNALKNRGDIYNSYYAIDRKQAVVDYQRVVALGDTSICSHLFLAKHNGWNLGTILSLPQLFINPCK
jgi:tetratricopeptide (TPR) repeat protein